jgi:hypothetical protein
MNMSNLPDVHRTTTMTRIIVVPSAKGTSALAQARGSLLESPVFD